jgi:hypothetical protein
VVSKEKFERSFELVFLAGGLLINRFSGRLRRAPATTAEEVGAAMHRLRTVFDEQFDRVPDPDAVGAGIGKIRAELCADRPRRLLLVSYLDDLSNEVEQVEGLVDAVDALYAAVTGWLPR